MLAVAPAQEFKGQPPPNELPGLAYTNAFFPGATFRTSIPRTEDLLGFSAGQRAANSREIETCLQAWAKAASNRTRLVEYARSHEDRPLHYIVVSAPRNIERINEIQAGMAKLANPRNLPESEATALMDDLPAIAWLAYAIHGDETEGSDAALAVLYHLLAAEDPEIERLLEDLVIIVDPVMNPDGRDRFLKMIAEHRGAMPNVDDHSLLHTGYWPWGRGNHYLFDLNRDSILAVHPETRGRIREIGRWNPLLLVDAHGMGSQETHLFSPPREPINPNFPSGRAEMAAIFTAEQAAAFDRGGLLYYTREWLENWYPGYTDAWASHRGAIGILYEQARIAEDGVRRPGGRILSYRESVFHHVIGTFANLHTLQKHRGQMLRHFHNSRKEAVDPNGRYGNRTFAILPTENRSRVNELLANLRLQGIEFFTTPTPFHAPISIDQLGRQEPNRQIPAGTVLIPNRQPLAHLIAAMLEFDPQIQESALIEEREELLRNGDSRIYDITAWNLTMMSGLPALTLSMHVTEGAVPFVQEEMLVDFSDTALAWVIDGADDKSVAAAARLLERGAQVRVSEKRFRFNDREFSRGSVVVTRLDNRPLGSNIGSHVRELADQLGLSVHSITQGLGSGAFPDLGGSHFKRLEPPRIGVIGRGGINAYDFGAIWHFLDQQLAIRHSHLSEDLDFDLSRYNVLVLPDRWGGRLSIKIASAIEAWVKAGGTLVAIGHSTANLMSEPSPLSQARALPDTLSELHKYELAVLREWQSRNAVLPPKSVLWSHRAVTQSTYPWTDAAKDAPDEKELKRRDAWNRIFMPQGAILSTRIDPRHWLTLGCEEPFPVLLSKLPWTGPYPVLMAAEGVEAPIRFGYLTPASESASSAPAEKKSGESSARIGWSALPSGTEMQLRMSGLLWPEAAQRIANTAFITREKVGRGQVILFASPPVFRGSSHGTSRVFANAIVYGPGFGVDQPIVP